MDFKGGVVENVYEPDTKVMVTAFAD